MMGNTLKIAVFISGRGSNLRSLIEACADDSFPAEIALVLSNRSDAGGLQFAKEAGITTTILPHKKYRSREEYDAALLRALEGHNIDLICLAGFMRLLTPTFITPWEGKIINIHPSLLPAHKGLHTHERVIEAGDSETGCTIHYVVPEMDSGEIIVQKHVSVTAEDTAETLAQKVLQQEHIAYPEAVKIVAEKMAKQA